MAVQFNLLPDVKLEFAKQQRAKRLVYSVSALASIIAVSIFLISFVSVNVVQKRSLNNAGNKVTTYTKKLNDIQDLAKVLTIQNQLNSLPALHQQKHYTSRLFTYLPQITPIKASIGKIDMDMAGSTLEITGNADTVETVNIYVDTFKFTGYALKDVKDKDSCVAAKGTWDKDNLICALPAFSNVVLTSVGKDDKGASYKIDVSFDPALFTGETAVKLAVPPNKVTTRSVINAPDANSPLFNGQVKTTSGAQ